MFSSLTYSLPSKLGDSGLSPTFLPISKDTAIYASAS